MKRQFDTEDEGVAAARAAGWAVITDAYGYVATLPDGSAAVLLKRTTRMEKGTKWRSYYEWVQ